jgi:hypothetical protein
MRNGVWGAELHLLAFAVDYIRKVSNIVQGSRTNNQHPRDHQIQLTFEASYLAALAPHREEDREMPRR